MEQINFELSKKTLNLKQFVNEAAKISGVEVLVTSRPDPNKIYFSVRADDVMKLQTLGLRTVMLLNTITKFD